MRLYRQVVLLFLFFLLPTLAYVLPEYFFTLVSASKSTIPPSSTEASSTHEEISNLAYYTEAERLDPIFAIEGTDPVKLRAAVASLFAERDHIALWYPPDERNTIETALYPNAFLTILPDLEEARQLLLADPTVAHARAYHSELDQTIGLYALGARAIAQAFQSVSSTIPSMGYVGGTASTTDVAAKIKKAASFALLQKQKEDARYHCFEQFSNGCPTLASLKGLQQAAVAKVVPTLPAPSSSVYRVDALWKKILTMLPTFISASKQTYAIPSSCFAEDATYVREYYSEHVPGETARKQLPVNDLYFYDVPTLLQVAPSEPSFKALASAGISVESQNMGNLYECVDSGFDVTSVGSIIGVLDGIKQKQTLTKDEQKILRLSVVQKSDLKPYVVQSVAGNSVEGDALAERYIQGSADFDQTIMGAYSDNYFLIRSGETKPVQYELLLLVRNFPSTMLLLGNPTFISQQTSLFSDTTPNPPSKLALRTYLNDVSKQYTDTEILEQEKKAINIAVAPQSAL